MKLLHELQRRNVLKVAIAYAVTAYVVVEASSLLLDIFNAPDWAAQTIVVMLAVGFPVALVFSWMYEWTPEGIKADDEVGADLRGHGLGRHLALLTIAMGMVAIGLFLVGRFVVDGAPDYSDGSPVIAVLPFEIIGSDDGSGLADGLHHDLLTRMSKIRAFAVISRTSMLEYTNTTKNMRVVGEELGAGFIVEGGVQTVGNHVRINAQLIDAARDKHLWADTYDREISAESLFAIQSELASAIANQLQLALSAGDRAHALNVPTTNTEAYIAYLRAVAMFDDPAADGWNIIKAHELIREALRLDPAFVPAWVQLLRHSGYWEIASAPNFLAEMTNALETIRRLAPGSYEAGFANVIYLYYVKSDYGAVLPAIAELESLGALDADALYMQGKAYRRAGKLEEAYQSYLNAARLDPHSARIADDLLMTSVLAGNCGRARIHVETVMAQIRDPAEYALARADFELQCTGDAARAGELVRDIELTNDWAFWKGVEAAVMRRDWAHAIELLERGERVDNDWLDPLLTRVMLARALRHSGRVEEADAVLDEIKMTVDDHPNEEITADFANLMLQYSSARKDSTETRRWADYIESQARASGPFDPLSSGSVYRDLAFTYAGADMADEAVDALRRMFEGGSFVTFRYIEQHPAFDSIRNHPGYAELRERYGVKD